MPWTYRPKPENVMVVPEVHDRVVEAARRRFAEGVRLLRQETGLPLGYSVALVQHWLRSTT